MNAQIFKIDHELYSMCTLYTDGELGLAVIQQRFNRSFKCTWWGPVDKKLTEQILEHEHFEEYFLDHAKVCPNGIYPTVTVRQVMWALGMKPLKKKPWETRF